MKFAASNYYPSPHIAVPEPIPINLPNSDRFGGNR
jgi:hypothetical protein